MIAPERRPPSELMREAASLLHLMGGMGSRHLVLIGGMVPPLLAPNAAVAHLGSADIDFCISVAMTEGTTRQYAESLQELIAPYFEPASTTGHRWRKRADAPGLPLIVDFLASKTDDTAVAPDGVLEPATEVVEHNLGVRLTPFAIRAGELVDRDAEKITVEDVDLLYDRATADVDVRFAGPVGFLMAKADALFDRNETKDGYDVAWWCLHVAPNPDDVAQIVIPRPAYRDELFPEAVAELQRAFKSPDAPGPHGYATEMHPDLEPGDRDYDLARNLAFAAVSAVVEELRKSLWS
jgi:hypothetical protein